MNRPHEPQAAARARAGELTDGEQLRECINSGQVSAAQVVAHAENGDFKPLCARCGEFGECIPRGTDSCEPSMSMFVNRKDYEQYLTTRLEAAIQDRNEWKDATLSANERFKKAETALAAERAEVAEVARIREAAEAVLSNEEHAFSGGMRNYKKGSQTWQVYEDLRIALAAPGVTK